MDFPASYTEGTVAERLALGKKVFEELEKAKVVLIEDWKQLIADLEAGMEAARPVLPVPATSEQRLAAVKILTKKHVSLIYSHLSRRTDLSQKEWKISEGRSGLSVLYLRISHKNGHFQGYVSKESEKIDKALNKQDTWTIEETRLQAQAQGLGDAALLQRHIQKMMEGQDEAARNSVLIENNENTAHLTRYWTRPFVQVNPERDQTYIRGGKYYGVPVEIAEMIYAQCDLESCVNLRIVNSFWLSVYQQSDHILESKVKERFPWMVPEAELFTWGDCALVFAGRLRSEKWSTVDSLNKLFQRRRGIGVRTVLAEELKEDQKMSSDFEGLVAHDEATCTGGCEHLHFIEKLPRHNRELPGSSPSLNPWTLEFQNKVEKADFKVVREDEEKKEKVIEYQGFEFTIPASVTPDGRREGYGSDAPVTINSEHIVVRAENRILVIPRDKPHFKHGFEYEQDEGSFELGNIYASKLTYVGSYNDYKQTYNFWDCHGKQFIQYVSRTPAIPIASYNGLIWFEAKNYILLPTFIDLKNPGKIYYRKDHIICFPDPRMSRFSLRRMELALPMIENFKQCSRRRHAQQFIVKRSDTGLLLVDLMGRTATSIQTPDDTPYRIKHIFPGYVKSWFHARYMTDETVAKYKQQAKDKFGKV